MPEAATFTGNQKGQVWTESKEKGAVPPGYKANLTVIGPTISRLPCFSLRGISIQTTVLSPESDWDSDVCSVEQRWNSTIFARGDSRVSAPEE